MPTNVSDAIAKKRASATGGNVNTAPLVNQQYNVPPPQINSVPRNMGADEMRVMVTLKGDARAGIVPVVVPRCEALCLSWYMSLV